MDEILDVMNEVSLIIWDDGIEIILVRQIAQGLPKVYTTIWPLLTFLKQKAQQKRYFSLGTLSLSLSQ